MLTPIADIHVFDDEDEAAVVELLLNEILEEVALRRLVMNAPIRSPQSETFLL